MLKNKKIVYFCQECGYESAKWMGQCPGCKAWNTFVEEAVSTKTDRRDQAKGETAGACDPEGYQLIRGRKTDNKNWRA